MYCKHDSIDTSIYLIFTSGDIDVRCQVDEVAEEESEGEEFPGHHRYIKIFTGCPKTSPLRLQDSPQPCQQGHQANLSQANTRYQ